MHDVTVEILENKKINAVYWKLTFSSSKLSDNVRPGQFLNIQIENSTAPLWRRPFSYYRVSGPKVEILYEVVGCGTEKLSQKKRGSTLKILGPLGKGFSQKIGAKRRILVGGGCGVPPLIFLAGKTKLSDSTPPILLFGCQSDDAILPKTELSKLKNLVSYATEDGSCGTKGFVTKLLEKILKENNPKKLFIQTCGPKAMMEAVMRMARTVGVDGELSFDERMACGIGACLGCVVETKEGRKTSCHDGPVFSFEELP
ncbi:MAG: hypothetical protein A3G33_11375 [Omnitrophica bacterium RIFCSPLOWO2_12_FULL_44_17]|uniref:FAD-binding FR-type domain-containing protein n=1 Tax=Candidatus Danuiimicrobium aquiferis TaxID=1801832 RepID=A0A1G1KS00_9BACT|nr:MAG: hypothetical protein A3B72_09210 [Omnitrophica bacterium RIFCSPHIGHO2_02_FULL_45_28]OGW91882.1 MAG: hypothetical protein A3E74_02265 [Omnitrophica bacterium RIFCSPHIGHO2_12_FULL_44_12]OGW95592.1 MAG: hypothetical protein A3G33_11375 [Omnitrophica bacterium RIFCSPLOWO2_12_FULL_44_17]OGX03693.1 MAG: hypothetical protein A3J12_01115 [Omnitrophica bacterium RIFCSPLOWO2_02_FULL_44_11]